jgi:catechol 2,3-dioxygenase-like lactoylglutathione lyase family enzyme
VDVIARVELEAPADVLDDLGAFYAGTLGLPVDGHTVTVGTGALAFAPADGDARPFYHFAWLVPGDRFDAARVWAAERTELLPGEPGDVVFDFSFWDALACYFHDPAGNIVELIAHRGIAEGATGAFDPAELAAISEIGIVTARPADAVGALERELGLELWSGGVQEVTGLGFVGRKAHTLIISGERRGWLPTGRPAEPHPVAVTIAGGAPGEAALPGTPARVTVAG